MADLIVREGATLRIDGHFPLEPKYGLFRMEPNSSIIADVDLVITARRAEFGANCIIDASGRSGSDGPDGGPVPPRLEQPPTARGADGRSGADGGAGQNGHRVTLEAALARVGSLAVITDGGRGGSGGVGQAGGQGAPFGDGGNGGRGGNGGSGGDAGEIIVRWTPLAPELREQPGQPPAGHTYRSQGGAGGGGGTGGVAGAAGGADNQTRGGVAGVSGAAGSVGAARVAGVEWRPRTRTLLWVQKQNMGPAPRRAHAMAWDPVRGRLVLFGGSRNADFSGDTWEWDGELWIQVSDIGPSPRARHAMAFDPVNGQVLLFGGVGNEPGQAEPIGLLADTWLWDGQDWAQVADSGPSPRQDCALATDPVRRRIVLFGGQSRAAAGGTALLGDTWEWDGSEWAQHEDVGPGARRGGSMAYDRAGENVVLFGGQDGAMFADTWGWNGDHWKQLADMGPSGRVGHALASDGNGVILFGGRTAPAREAGDGTPVRETWAFHDQRWRQIQDMGPSARFEHAIAYDDRDERLILFGGQDSGDTQGGDTWCLVERPRNARALR